PGADAPQAIFHYETELCPERTSIFVPDLVRVTTARVLESGRPDSRVEARNSARGIDQRTRIGEAKRASGWPAGHIPVVAVEGNAEKYAIARKLCCCVGNRRL